MNVDHVRVYHCLACTGKDGASLYEQLPQNLLAAKSAVDYGLQAACQMLMHGDQKLEAMLLNITNPDWQQQVEDQAVDIVIELCLDSTGEVLHSVSNQICCLDGLYTWHLLNTSCISTHM